MSGDEGPRLLYLVLLLVLVASSLVGMRLPLAKAARMALAWVAIFALGFILFAFRDDFAGLGQRLRAEATGAAIASGEELRVPIAQDGHYWVEAEVNGRRGRFLVDSGASITTVSRGFAEAAGIEPGMQVAQVETANGTLTMARGTAERFQVGTIERRDFAVHINPTGGPNVIGMNFLSRLASWRVEGNYLVLRA